MSDVLHIVTNVGTPLALVGVAVTIAYYAYVRRLNHEDTILRHLPPAERATRSDERLTRYGLTVDGFDVAERVSLIKDESDKIYKKALIYVYVAAGVFLICFCLAVLAYILRINTSINETTHLSGKLAALEEKHSTLATQYGTLKAEAATYAQRLEAIEERSVKERAVGLELLSQHTTFDLTSWRPLDAKRRLLKREYPITTRKTYTIVKVFKEIQKWSSTFGTSSPFDPVFSCETHKMSPLRDDDLIPPGKPALHRWMLDVDISKESLFESFDVKMTILVYNSFPGPTRENCGTLITYPTKHASIEVLFPAGKTPAPKSLTFTSYTLATSQPPTPFPNPDYRLDTNNTRLHWAINDPRLGNHYQVEWDW